MATRDELRAATLGETAKFTSEEVEYNGQKYEIREPTIKQRTVIMQQAKVTGSNEDKRDLGKLVAWACVECVYVPDTQEHVYEVADVEGMINRPCKSWVSVFGDKVLEAMNVKADEASKN